MSEGRKAIRQGDIFLLPIAEEHMPSARVPVSPEDGKLILARGEVTGHHHSVAVHDRVAMYMDTGSSGLFLMAGVPTKLEHQEHSTLQVPAGAWRVVRQRTVLSVGTARMVAD